MMRSDCSSISILSMSTVHPKRYSSFCKSSSPLKTNFLFMVEYPSGVHYFLVCVRNIVLHGIVSVAILMVIKT